MGNEIKKCVEVIIKNMTRIFNLIRRTGRREEARGTEVVSRWELFRCTSRKGLVPQTNGERVSPPSLFVVECFYAYSTRSWFDMTCWNSLSVYKLFIFNWFRYYFPSDLLFCIAEPLLLLFFIRRNAILLFCACTPSPGLDVPGDKLIRWTAKG